MKGVENGNQIKTDLFCVLLRVNNVLPLSWAKGLVEACYIESSDLCKTLYVSEGRNHLDVIVLIVHGFNDVDSCFLCCQSANQRAR